MSGKSSTDAKSVDSLPPQSTPQGASSTPPSPPPPPQTTNQPTTSQNPARPTDPTTPPAQPTTDTQPQQTPTQQTQPQQSQPQQSPKDTLSTDSKQPVLPTDSKKNQPVIVTSIQSDSSGSIITVTSTSYSYESSGVPSITPKKPLDSNSGGSTDSTNVMTAAIVVGTVVVAAAIGIWIFRKWKLSPSRNFKEKIQPVERNPETDTAFLRDLNEPGY